jgi:hypothetical protein
VGLVDQLRRGLAVRCALVVACRARQGRASGVADLCLGEELCARAWIPCRLGKRALEVVVELLDTRRRRHEDGVERVVCFVSLLDTLPFRSTDDNDDDDDDDASNTSGIDHRHLRHQRPRSGRSAHCLRRHSQCQLH